MPVNYVRLCEKCFKENKVSLEENTFVCFNCGHLNEFDNEETKEALKVILEKAEKIKNRHNN